MLDNILISTNEKKDDLELVLADDDQMEINLSDPDSLNLVDDTLALVEYGKGWKILVVDDDPEVHSMTRLSLRGFQFEDKTLDLLFAHSGDEALRLMENHPDTAIILLDVVMETDNSGLHVARYIREKLQNNMVRIVLRTGQPGEAPEESVIVEYDINEYRTKTELTRQKLFTTMTAALRSYRDLLKIEMSRQAVEAYSLELKQLNGQLQQEVFERKQAQAALAVARDQALEASRLKSELLTKVNHELRTPLNIIMGYSEMLEASHYGQLTGKQTEVVSMVIDSADYLHKRVNELLDQAKLESGHLTLDIGPLAPNELLEQILSQLTVLAETKSLILTGSIAPDVPSILLGDEDRIQQIMLNLVGNAIKFTAEGGVDILIYRPDLKCWALQVTDTGPGIPFEAQSYIFEPFRQIDSSSGHVRTGVGLGLSIVKQLANLMSGQVIVKSEPGKGSTFTVILPLKKG